jgi:hypothetical protein
MAESLDGVAGEVAVLKSARVKGRGPYDSSLGYMMDRSATSNHIF